jgi:glycosyltransferase involved in cell wall biosynthesis
VRVGLNAEPLFQRIPTGVGVYALELCRGLVEIGHAGDLVFFHAHHEDEAESEMDDLPVDRAEFTLSRDRLYEAWMADRRPPPQSITGDLDVVHSVGPAIPPAGGAALVVTVHDLAPIRFADRYPRRARALYKRGAHIAAAEAARIIVPSRSTALDVEEFYGVERERIRVVPHGVDIADPETLDDHSVGDAGRRWERRGIAEPYVLWVGTQEQRKNVVAVLDAFAHVAARHPELSLVLHGPNGWLGDEVGEGLQKRGLHGRTIVSEGSLPRNELAALYARASVFVYPSLYEGFGLPVLEAMACGTPVVTSNISALPETAGDAALLVDPLDDLALAEAIARIVEDRVLAEDLAARGQKRAKAFTWGETARRTWAVYEEARDASA